MASPKVKRAVADVHPLTPEEIQQEEDAHWALHEPEVQEKFAGQFIVPYSRQIIAHGNDVKAVLDEAARITGRKAEELPLCGVDDPLLDIPY